MKWYTVSIIISCRLREGKQEIFPVYENYTLFEAKNINDAFNIATEYAKEYIKIDNNLKLNGKEAYWNFEGIRKIVELKNYFSDDLDVDKPTSGVEVSYSYMETDNENTLRDLATGKEVYIRYNDD